MPNILIIHSSTDGHTITICKRIAGFLNTEDKIRMISLEEAKNFNLDKFNKIIIGASIRYGKHQKKLYNFIKLNKNLLDQKQNAFFSVNVVARKMEKNTPDTNPYIKKFLKISDWKPKKKLEFLLGKLITQIMGFSINM